MSCSPFCQCIEITEAFNSHWSPGMSEDPVADSPCAALKYLETSQKDNGGQVQLSLEVPLSAHTPVSLSYVQVWRETILVPKITLNQVRTLPGLLPLGGTLSRAAGLHIKP